MVGVVQKYQRQSYDGRAINLTTRTSPPALPVWEPCTSTRLVHVQGPRPPELTELARYLHIPRRKVLRIHNLRVSFVNGSGIQTSRQWRLSHYSYTHKSTSGSQCALTRAEFDSKIIAIFTRRRASHEADNPVSYVGTAMILLQLQLLLLQFTSVAKFDKECPCDFTL